VNENLSFGRRRLTRRIALRRRRALEGPKTPEVCKKLGISENVRVKSEGGLEMLGSDGSARILVPAR
jgi:hypothetical protein